MNWDSSERRRFVRVNLPCKIIIDTPSRHTISSHTENIGAGGLRVIIDEKLEILSMVGIELYLGEDTILSKGRVVWRVARKTLLFDTGLEFYEISDEDREIISNLVEATVLGKK